MPADPLTDLFAALHDVHVKVADTVARAEKSAIDAGEKLLVERLEAARQTLQRAASATQSVARLLVPDQPSIPDHAERLRATLQSSGPITDLNHAGGTLMSSGTEIQRMLEEDVEAIARALSDKLRSPGQGGAGPAEG